MKFQRKVGLVFGAILSILILAACSDKIEISNESLEKQLIGKSLTLNGNEIEITSDMLKSVKI